MLERLDKLTSVQQQALIDLAWKCGGLRVAEFARRCHQDHPDKVAERGYLLPTKSPENFESVAFFLRDILLAWRGSLKLLRDRELDKDPSDIRMLERRAEDAFRLLKHHVPGLETTDQADFAALTPQAQLLVADATESYVYICAWFASSTFRKRVDERFVSGQERDWDFSPHALVINSDELKRNLGEKANIAFSPGHQRMLSHREKHASSAQGIDSAFNER